ncbi:uncharacterized protein MYCFIDRAFT_164748 [Pseudocercospora fijiensis CIRAD86]|uniref:UBC core domain-containing protein n=1 Tax=Pseudocercospora fijiensis (strain CIRAD86) TaxID=383855 RepID=M3B2I4_PSEFD|nr:uncharacterized protein MYCFIDRAFT_164748 [Pseudocercospora fijiensis CIRAD86]EME83612.1 hypothetical protein MYCFIDRAFT_164748 [Pseudocercospora fijiensis CIRAD86]
MPRRQFVADLEKVKTGTLPLGISDVKAGEDDGQVEFRFSSVKITAMVTDLADYPKSHEYMVFGDDDAPRDISNALQGVRGTDRKTVFEMLDIISTTLSRAQPDRDGDSQMQDSACDDEEDDLPENDDSDASDGFDDGFGSDNERFGFTQPTATSATTTAASQPIPTSTRLFRQRIREDLRVAKAAGFKVGVLGHLLHGNNSYVTISIRIAKLGISEEAMQAWQLEPSEYLTLIIQYPNGYKTNEEFAAYDSIRLAPNIAMRVVVGKRYKPTLQEAIKAFTVVKKNDRSSISVTDLPKADEHAAEISSIRETFISKPLVGLMQERLIPIIRFRGAGLDWQGAESHYQYQVSSAGTAANADMIADEHFEREVISEAFPNIMRADHYAQYVARGKFNFSFPLLAMQFALRHFVRCTEFCLVCHRKLNSEVEAIKPYVCDDSLCLYQYMSLGLGPSIEHELIAQPYTVDLLVSFCYSSAMSRKLKDFPDGLSLTVLPVNPKAYNVADPYAYYGYRGGVKPATESKTLDSRVDNTACEVGYDRQKGELIFFAKPDVCPVRSGDWIVITSPTIGDLDLHCRVKDTSFYPTVSVYQPIELPQQHQSDDPNSLNGRPQTPASTTPNSPAISSSNWVQASFQVYNQDFAKLSQNDKCLSICRLLETLPPVLEMRDYLTKTNSADLKKWIERISPSALSLLRWIIASNRSCIMQVDGDETGTASNGSKKPVTVFSKSQERCYGMKDYMQFRFAMGAPDKEQRFINEVRATTDRLGLQYPTIFAWHGSPLHNWHMIIREGLHFKNADHGRAFGDGVYHAKDAQISTGYSNVASYGGSGRFYSSWPNSSLRISSALALNEIVNAPAEFTSSNPYYVVKQLDWIQTRYLFVNVAPKSDSVKIGADVKPQNAHPQDPIHTPKGISDAVVIPASAIKSSKTARGVAVKETAPKNPNPSKKMKLFGSATAINPIVIDDDSDGASVATDTEDREILLDEPEVVEPPQVANVDKKSAGKAIVKNALQTDFVPGSLDFKDLPLMPLPEYATSATTKRLMKELQNLAKVQESTSPAELGWYIDVEKIDNAYQWIVELHSFHTFEKLPLADEMKKQNIKSIVLEIRFNKDFPFTPPYVRVVRPQFLTFNQGGGGHIVMGGAMCMELLTNTGWSSVSTMESVLMQIRMAIASEPYARLNKNAKNDYGVGEAAEGYMRACATHGWQVPPGFKEMAYGMKKGSDE